MEDSNLERCISDKESFRETTYSCDVCVGNDSNDVHAAESKISLCT